MTVNFKNPEIEYTDEFYTDKNCLGMGRRKVRETDDPTQQVPRNYFSIGCAMSVQDSSKRMTVTTERSLGGTTHKGRMEFMQNRRIDGMDMLLGRQGLSESYTEGDAIEVVNRYHLILEEPKDQDTLRRMV